jgi:hypothetical protein
MISAEKQLQLAEQGLEQAKQTLSVHLALEIKASADPAAYSAWQERRASLESDIQRNANVVSMASEQVAAEKLCQALETRDERNRANEALANRL